MNSIIKTIFSVFALVLMLTTGSCINGIMEEFDKAAEQTEQYYKLTQRGYSKDSISTLFSDHFLQEFGAQEITGALKALEDNHGQIVRAEMLNRSTSTRIEGGRKI